MSRTQDAEITKSLCIKVLTVVGKWHYARIHLNIIKNYCFDVFFCKNEICHINNINNQLPELYHQNK